MSRIRTIKPDFWTSAQIMDCSPIARLLFVGMWNFADDSGRMAYSPKTLKAQIFPSDESIKTDDVARMIVELSSNGLILIYAVDDKEYIQVTGWHHQKIDRPKPSKLPDPFVEKSSNVRRPLATDPIVSYPIVSESKKAEAAPNGARLDSRRQADELPKTKLYRVGEEVLGRNTGGFVSKLLAAKKGDVDVALAALESARGAHNPREYIGKIIREPAIDDICPPDIYGSLMR